MAAEEGLVGPDLRRDLDRCPELVGDAPGEVVDDVDEDQFNMIGNAPEMWFNSAIDLLTASAEVGRASKETAQRWTSLSLAPFGRG